jgi:hypothetical protein
VLVPPLVKLLNPDIEVLSSLVMRQLTKPGVPLD